jgi:hypothetical protein
LYCHDDDQVIIATFSGSPKNINLPYAGPNSGRVIYIKKGVLNTDRVYVNPQSGEKIDNDNTKSFTNDRAFIVVSDGSNWFIIAQY